MQKHITTARTAENKINAAKTDEAYDKKKIKLMDEIKKDEELTVVDKKEVESATKTEQKDKTNLANARAALDKLESHKPDVKVEAAEQGEVTELA